MPLILFFWNEKAFRLSILLGLDLALALSLAPNNYYHLLVEDDDCDHIYDYYPEARVNAALLLEPADYDLLSSLSATAPSS